MKKTNNSINIGDKNKIKNSSIGTFTFESSNNKKKGNSFFKWLFGIVATIISGIIIALLKQYFNL